MTTSERGYHIEPDINNENYDEYYNKEVITETENYIEEEKRKAEIMPIQIENKFFKPEKTNKETNPEENDDNKNNLKLSINTEPSWNKNKEMGKPFSKEKSKRKPFLKGKEKQEEVSLSIDTTLRVEKEAFEGVRWEYKQLFGGLNEGDNIDQADIITALSWNKTGDYMAIGDQGGRIIVLKRDEQSKSTIQEKEDEVGNDSSNQEINKQSMEFNVFTDFTSHDSQFDYLQSLEIDERINNIEWCYEGSDESKFILCTNEKCIKMWKISEQSKPKFVQPKNIINGVSTKKTIDDIEMPSYEMYAKEIINTEKRTYKSVHEFQIHSLSLCADQEMFVSADDLRINLWHLSCPNKTHTIVDLAPEDMKDLDVIITNTTFHPYQCSIFAYATTVGSVHLCDLREGSTARDGLIMKSQSNSFHESINSVSHVSFNPIQDSYQIISRDYMSLKLWDTRLPREPLMTMDVHEGIRHHLADLYEVEYIFDKFTSQFSHDGLHVITGSYRSNFMIYDIKRKLIQRLEASPTYIKNSRRHARFSNTPYPMDEPVYQGDDFTKKCLQTHFHPTQLACATATGTSLYLFEGMPQQK
mmetsp:Transcript_4685/g.6934  ORF Transcript_4685/g.6934 Transcript_4685/m.6934 type:complete len:585 (+) Transcript_4685:278-2032(+)